MNAQNPGHDGGAGPSPCKGISNHRRAMLRRCSLFDIPGRSRAARCISLRRCCSRRTSPVYGGGGPRIARWRGVHLALTSAIGWRGRRKWLPSPPPYGRYPLQQAGEEARLRALRASRIPPLREAPCKSSVSPSYEPRHRRLVPVFGRAIRMVTGFSSYPTNAVSGEAVRIPGTFPGTGHSARGCGRHCISSPAGGTPAARCVPRWFGACRKQEEDKFDSQFQ